MVLSFEDITTFKFSWGAILVLLATLCWGFENNCTRNLASKNTFHIVFLKCILSFLIVQIKKKKKETVSGFDPSTVKLKKASYTATLLKFSKSIFDLTYFPDFRAGFLDITCLYKYIYIIGNL